MATTVNSDVIIHNQLAQTAYLERLQDNLAVFNQASRGAILLADKHIEGDYSREAFYKIGGEIEHRDVNSTAEATAKKVSMGERVGVKTPFKYGPYEMTEEALKRRNRSVNEFSLIVGQDYADALIKGYFKYAMAAVSGAIESNTSMNVKAKFAEHHKKVLTKGLRLFGDKAERIALWVMDSAAYFDLVDDAIGEKMFGEVDQVIYGGTPGTMGKPVLVTDQAPKDRIIGLQAGAVQITNSQLPEFRAYQVNDRENLTLAIRAEGAFNIDILGYSYKDTAGANPNLATIGAKANWEKYATSDKNTAGIIVDVSAV